MHFFNNGAKKPPVRAAGVFGNDLRNGGDGGHGQDDQAQHDTVKTEELEVMALDVIHQEADGGKADHKGNHAAHHEDSDLSAGHRSAGEDELDQL